MNEELQKLIESLREELRQYGQMLVLLDDQQGRIIQRHNDELLDATAAVNTQGTAIQTARRQREGAQRDLAHTLQVGGDSPLTHLAPLLPPDYRPLLNALMQENNHLLQRVQQRARQNHVLLRRSLELLDQFINSFCPAKAPVYNGAGSLQAGLETGASLYEAVG
jgi:flagellar biosynthesis/type III secretory pathway chaperone